MTAGLPKAILLSSIMARMATPTFLYALLIFGAIPILIPFVWMLSSSLKTKEHVGEYPPRILPYNEHSYLRSAGSRFEVLRLAELPYGKSKVRMPDGQTVNVA